MNNEGNDATRKWLAGDLISAFKEAVRPNYRAGNANTTFYVDLWNHVEGKILPKNLNDYGHPETSHN